MSKVKKKIKHLVKHFGFKKAELGEVEKMYNGEFFDCNDPAYIRLLECSKQICEQYSAVLNDEMNTKSKNKKLKLNVFTYLKFYFKKLKILKLIFPIHGFILYAENGIEAVIGLVDLKGYGFINRDVKFTQNSLVVVKKSNIFAFDIQVGDKGMQKVGNLGKLSTIIIDKNCWIGAGVKVLGDVCIGRDSVVGAGAIVKENIEPFSLAVGRPCKKVKTIDKQIKKENYNCDLFKDYEKNIAEHIKSVNFGKYPIEYQKMIGCQEFNSMSKKLSYLYSLTRLLCFELNDSDTTKERREEILNMLFPNHGENLKVGKNIYVDMLGTVLLGANVEIGNNVFLGGNVCIEDEATIGDGVILSASGHSLHAKERTMRFSLKKGFYETTQYGSIIVKKNIKIKEGAIVAPNSVVNKDVPENALFVKNKIIL